MKSKLVILSLLLSGAAVVATAQTKEKYYSESWKDNIFISVGVGLNVVHVLRKLRKKMILVLWLTGIIPRSA